MDSEKRARVSFQGHRRPSPGSQKQRPEEASIFMPVSCFTSTDILFFPIFPSSNNVDPKTKSITSTVPSKSFGEDCRLTYLQIFLPTRIFARRHREYLTACTRHRYTERSTCKTSSTKNSHSTTMARATWQGDKQSKPGEPC